MRIFGKKTVKIVSASGTSPGFAKIFLAPGRKIP